MGFRRAQSESIGIILLTVVVVVTVGVGGYAVLDDIDQSRDVLVSIEEDVETDRLTLTHTGGDSLAANDIRVVVSGSSSEQSFTVDAANLTGSDDRFDPSERVARDIERVGGTVRVSVVHVPTNTVLLNSRRQLDRFVGAVLEWVGSAAWDGATTDTSVVHDGFGDHSADTVALGHARDSTGLVSYWPLDESAGATTATDVAGANDGSLNGPTAGTGGVFGTTAYEFSGSDTVRIPDESSLDRPASADAFTVGGWVNTTDSTGTNPVWSRTDGVGPDTGGDLSVAVRDGRLAALVGRDGALGTNVSRDGDDWAAGTFTDTTAASDGNLTLATRRGTAHGQFAIPGAAGQQTVTTGFEPDLVVFRTVVAGAPFGETTNVGGQAIGTGYGFADCTGSGCTEVAQSAGSGSASPNAQAARSTDSYSVYQAVTDANGDSYVGTVKGSVVATNGDSFTIGYDAVATGGPRVLVSYSAYKFEDGADVDVGSFRTPTAETTGTQSISTGFEPNSVRTITGPEIQSQNYARPPNVTEFGWSRGWAIDNESRSLTTQTTTVGETGTVTAPADGGWTTVNFGNSYTDPVVVGTTNTVGGGSPLVFDVRNVGPDSADVRLCESEGADGDGCDTHGQETVGYVVVDAAVTDDVEGITAGRRAVGDSFSTATFTESFSEFDTAPAVLADTQTVNGTGPVDARVIARSASGFEAGICYQDGLDSCAGSHPQETVGWVAVSDAAPLDQQVSVGRVDTDGSDWETVSYPSYPSPPVVVASTQTENGGQELATDEVRNVGTDSAEVRFCEVDSGDNCDTHTTETVAYVAAPTDTPLTVSQVTRHEQVAISHAAYAENIDDHVYAASDRRLIDTLWTNKGGIDGRVSAHLESFDGSGFTLDYTRNDPDPADGKRFLVTYVAVNSTAEPELGHAQTPTGTGEVTYETTGRPSSLTLTGHNAIPSMDTTGYSGANQPENHFGWTTGGGDANGTGRSVGFSSHSNSVNENAVGSQATAFHLLYADQNGNVLGTDTAEFAGATQDSFTLNWTSTVTSSTANVKFDRTAFVWHSYGGTTGYETNGEWQSATVTTDEPVVWNETAVTATIPSGTGVDVDYSDGNDWYETIGAVPKTDSVTYNVTLTGTTDSSPRVERIRSEYLTRAAERRWTTDSQSEWTSGSFSGTSAVDGRLELRGNAIGEAGRVTTADAAWQTISFDSGYTNPVVVGTANTDNGPSALTVDVRNVDASAGTAEIRVCEAEGYTTDGCDTPHVEEAIGYMVVDAAALDSVDGIEAGTVRQGGGIDSSTQTVGYADSYGQSPVVLATVQSTEGQQPVEARVLDRSATEFTAGICHTGSLDACDDSHADVTVGWVAIEPGNVPIAGAEVAGTGDTVANSEWTAHSFATAFVEQPIVVAETQTDDGGEELQITEARSVTTNGVDVRYCEIETGDTCDTHTTEDIALFAVEPGPLAVGYDTTGEYRRQFDAGRTVEWTAVTVDKTTPSGTAVDVNYSDGSDWYDTLSAVPNSSTLVYNATLSGTAEDTPSVSNVTVQYAVDGWRTGSTPVADGGWHHVAATYDGTTLRLYVDGQLDSAATLDNTISPSTADAFIGGELTTGDYYSGRIDAVRLSDQALALETIEDRYNASQNGTVVTGQQAFDGPVDPTELSVTAADSTAPAATNATLFVESDPDGDGTFEERSDAIDLTGSSPYEVTGLTSSASAYRAVVRLKSTDRTAAPAVDRLVIEHTG